jgi:ribosomal protein S18 acetylase RimI-like enzyme
MWHHRHAELEDVDAVVALIESGYRGEASRQGWTTEADLLTGQRTDADEIRTILKDPAQTIFVFEEDGQIIGCIAITRKTDAAYLGMITVSPRLQGRGLGRFMIAEAEAFAQRDWGVSRSEMYVIRQRHELIAWYKRLGYLDTGRIEPFPYDEIGKGEAKRDDLAFVVLERRLVEAHKTLTTPSPF